MSTSPTYSKPNLEPKWFWDMDYEKIDWQASYMKKLYSYAHGTSGQVRAIKV